MNIENRDVCTDSVKKSFLASISPHDLIHDPSCEQSDMEIIHFPLLDPVEGSVPSKEVQYSRYRRSQRLSKRRISHESLNCNSCPLPSTNGNEEHVTANRVQEHSELMDDNLSLDHDVIKVPEFRPGKKKRRSIALLEALIEEMRETQASLAAKVALLDSRVSNCSSLFLRFQEQSVDPVLVLLHSLRQKLLILLQKPIIVPRASTAGRKTILDPSDPTMMRGVFTHVLKARTECTLTMFESLALRIFNKQRDNNGQGVSFFPPFHYTQKPAYNSSDFDIYFDKLSGLCDCLGIDSVVDRLNMLARTTQGRSRNLIRVLGSYVFDYSSKSSSPTFFIGTSCGNIHKQFTSDSNMQNMCRLKSRPVLCRSTGEYISEEERFACALHVDRKVPGGHVDPAIEGNEEAERRQFGLSWSRVDDLSLRQWSTSVCRSAQINGALEVSLPCVIAVGDATVLEFKRCLTRELQLEAIQ